MSNHDVHIGQNYMYRTYQGMAELLAEGQGEEGDPSEPLKFKLYQGLPHYPLSQSLSLKLGDARWSFEEFRQTHHPAPSCDLLTLERLSNLLYYTYGFSRHDVGSGVYWPFHRVVASARCFFPTELYVWIPQIEQLPAGLYHYDNLHHSLTLLRAGDYQAELSRMVGASVEGSAAVLMLSAHFWKTAFRYRNFAYRLCTQEAGIVLGNALIVSGTLGLQPHVHYQFLDRAINHLLGCEPIEESVFAVVPIYTHPAEGQMTRRDTAVTSHELIDQIAPITPKHLKRGAINRELCSLIIDLDQHSFLHETAEILAEPLRAAAPCATEAEHLLPSPIATKPVELTDALYARRSGDILFTPLGIPISQSTFWEIVRYALAPYINDLSRTLAEPRLHLYVAVNHVEGVERGVYRSCPNSAGLHIVEQRNVALQLQAVYSQPNVNCSSANMVCYIVGDFAAASAKTGNRSYRMLHMEGGVIAQRLCLMSAAYGLAARCSDGYYPQRCEELLQIDHVSATPLFQIVIGHERPGASAGVRYPCTIRF